MGAAGGFCVGAGLVAGPVAGDGAACSALAEAVRFAGVLFFAAAVLVAAVFVAAAFVATALVGVAFLAAVVLDPLGVELAALAGVAFFAALEALFDAVDFEAVDFDAAVFEAADFEAVLGEAELFVAAVLLAEAFVAVALRTGVALVAVAFLTGVVFFAAADFAGAFFAAAVFLAAGAFFAAVVAEALVFAGVFFAGVTLTGAADGASPTTFSARPATRVAAFFTEAGLGSFGSLMAPETTPVSSLAAWNCGTKVRFLVARFSASLAAFLLLAAFFASLLGSTFSNVPNPLMTTFSPRATSRVMVSTTASSAWVAAFLFPSNRAASASMS